MKEVKENKKWEVSIMELQTEKGVVYKVTRCVAEMGVAETKVFQSLDEARKQFEEWLY